MGGACGRAGRGLRGRGGGLAVAQASVKQRPGPPSGIAEQAAEREPDAATPARR